MDVSFALSELPKKFEYQFLKNLGYISPEKLSETYDQVIFRYKTQEDESLRCR